MARTEEWTKDIDGMTSTVVVDVKDDETVNVSDEIVEEFGLHRVDAKDTVDSVRERLVWAFPYEKVKERLEAEGWSAAA